MSFITTIYFKNRKNGKMENVEARMIEFMDGILFNTQHNSSFKKGSHKSLKLGNICICVYYGGVYGTLNAASFILSKECGKFHSFKSRISGYKCARNEASMSGTK